MSSIIEQVLEELDKHDVERVEEVDLIVGEFTFLGQDQLRFAFEIMVRDTPLEGAELNIETEDLEVECPSCGYVGRVEYLGGEEAHLHVPILRCPGCESRVNIIRGKNCGVTSMKVVER